MIKIINKSEEKISFKTDMPISLANAIRRSVNYIPTLAIDSLEISKNDSALYDEIISHRAGLIPLKNENLRLPEDCDCGKEEGCGKCSMKFKLSAQGPCTVYSDQISPKGNIVHKMPITLLDKNQELEFVAVAKMGKGMNHAKHTPGLLYYKYSEDTDEDVEFKKLVEDARKDEDRELEISVEAWGQMKAKEIFEESIKALNKEIKDLAKQIK